jgi:anthranilate synthase component 1
LAAPTEAWFLEHLIDPFPEVAGPGDLQRLHREHPSRYPFLLQSTTRGGPLSRFDILFAFPGKSLEASRFDVNTDAAAGKHSHFLDDLNRWWSAERVPEAQQSLPFLGGWFVYLGYELAGEIEPALKLRRDAVLPTAFAVRCPAALVFDHAGSQCFLVRESIESADVRQVREDVENLSSANDLPADILMAVREDEPGLFIEAVQAARRHIAAGDIYQANLSREWSVELSPSVRAADIYARLCDANPGPFAGIARWRDVEIISSSPERLLRVRNGIASTRPIAGTRPRSEIDAHDTSLSEELFSHPKELAEHVMLIDLERNDLGRICTAGSVEVDEMMVLESYAHVHHIVSNVKGRLRGDVLPGQAIAAVFPGGTITGCPKIRCMEIIAELEEGPRGAYTGSFGYLNRDGSMDLNILIRTMVKQGNQLSLRAGSGIVADSSPEAELSETRAKAKGMLRALGK